MIETMETFCGKAGQYRINIRKLMVTGNWKSPEETREVENSLGILGMKAIWMRITTL